MKYFTFIGTGNPNLANCYDEVSYSFNDDGTLVKSRFVQKAIVEKHKDKIDEVFVFVTKESFKLNGDALKECLKDVKLTFIEIDKDISFEEFSSKLLTKIYANDKIIIDVTHSFRHIPMKLLFALDYIEKAKNVKIIHLYYGRLNGKQAFIEDIAKDYRMRKMSDLLSQFDRTLIINAEDIKDYVSGDDEKISNFLTALAHLNEVIELCRFDECFLAIKEVLNLCKYINENEEEYQLILPFVKRIRTIFQMSNDNKVYNEIAFIKVLLDHNRFQVAITFIDQLLREELIRFTFYPKKVDCDTYLVSQTIMARSRLKNSKINENSKIFDNNKNNLGDLTVLVNGNKYDKKRVMNFYDKVRNHINHGEKINMSEDELRSICLDVLGFIKKLERKLNALEK